MTAPRDRNAYLRDVDFHATNLIRCLEGLAASAPSPELERGWQQSATATRRIRAFARHQKRAVSRQIAAQ